jgi:SAM-dependent methyltransferase
MAFELIEFHVKPSGDYAINEDPLTPLKLNIYLVVGLFVFSTIYSFIPLGRMIGLFFQELPSLTAYSVNISGSLIGIVVFSLLSYVCTPMWACMIVGLFPLLLLKNESDVSSGLSASWRLKYGAIVMLLPLLMLSTSLFNEHRFHYKKIWSPYYCLKFMHHSSELCQITIGNSFLLTGINLYYDKALPMINKVREYYELPYIFRQNPRDVLILGAGMGNDAAVALRHGAQSVDAVEIDPQIVELGKKYHPLKPYTDPRVRVILGDARTYTKNSNRKYDVIIYATLDSHSLFSQMSSLKMENYVYTLESFKEARKLLKEDGILYVNTGFQWNIVALRIYNCLNEAFGRDTLFLSNNIGIVMYINGAKDVDPSLIDQGASSIKRIRIDSELAKRETPESFLLPTDNWPQLFLKENKIPKEYLFSLLILFIVSALFIRFYFYSGSTKKKSFSLNYFFLGAGFMLIETKSITEMGLVFGATWLVNSIVISSILIIALLANYLVSRQSRVIPAGFFYIPLFTCLLLSYLFPLSSLNITNFFARLIAAGCFVSLPIFFSSSIFSINFRTSGSNSTFFLASNMLGAVFGGIVEYSSMIYGLKSLYVFAIALYFVSLLSMIQEERALQDNTAQV